jgi:cysteine desulfurase
MSIYLDHNAGSPMRPAARAAMLRWMGEAEHGNPAAVHRAGQRSRRMLEQARGQVADLIGVPARSLIFTSGGTESNNLAIFGVTRAFGGARRKAVTSAIEHSSVLAPMAELKARGFEVVMLNPDGDGRVDPAEVAAAVDHETALVTLGLANAEVGTVQELAPVARATALHGAILHVDAAQAVGRIPVRAEELGCDLMTMSAHKIGGPAGIGAIYVRPGCALAPAMMGGPQEGGLRAGTPNLIGAIGYGAAAEEAAQAIARESKQIEGLAFAFLKRLIAAIPGLRLNGPLIGRLPNTLNLAFPNVVGESLLIALDLEGVEVSMGSACAAGAVEPSHVLTAMGRSAVEARSSLRISLGWSTTAEETARAAEIIARVWRRVAATEPDAQREAPR